MIKEQIINTAFDLFSQYGIKSVSMDDVAKAAGISKRTLYESFEDKETLLIEGIDHNSESLGQYLTGLEKEPFNALEVILLFYEEMMKNPRWFNEKFYEDLKKYPKAQQKIEMNKARMGKRCMDLFTRGVKEGVFQEGINFEIMALLVKEQTKMLRPSNVFCKHSITEVCRFFRLLRRQLQKLHLPVAGAGQSIPPGHIQKRDGQAGYRCDHGHRDDDAQNGHQSTAFVQAHMPQGQALDNVHCPFTSSLAMRPSSMEMTRSACSAMRSSWVMMRRVC